MSKKLRALKDLDRDNDFYSEKAFKEWAKKMKRLEQEEREMIADNRRRYREQNKNKKED
jgi:hypothetical protein